MVNGGVTPVSVRMMPATFWVVPGLASVLLASAPVAVFIALAVLAAAMLSLAVVREPRGGLIGTLVLLYSYAGWVLGHRAGVPDDVTLAVLPLLLVIVAARRILAWEPVHEPREAGALVAVAFAWRSRLPSPPTPGAAATRSPTSSAGRY